MFLKLKHTTLDIFQATKLLVVECYKSAMMLPTEEKYAMTQQIRRAALPVHLNVAEGCSRKSQAERKRFYEIARGSLIEVDTAFDLAVNLKYCSETQLSVLGEKIVNVYKQLSGLISQDTHH